jgi:hypothetical protein
MRIRADITMHRRRKFRGAEKSRASRIVPCRLHSLGQPAERDGYHHVTVNERPTTKDEFKLRALLRRKAVPISMCPCADGQGQVGEGGVMQNLGGR